MEPKIQTKEWKLQQLLEQKDFSELSTAEKALVNEFLSPETYRLRRELLLTIQEEKTTLTPLPLNTPPTNTGIAIPLYQAILAIAATILVMLFLKLPYTTIINSAESQQIKYISVTDTIKEIEYIYDTVYKEIEKTKVVEKKVYIPKTEIQYVKVYGNHHLKSNQVLNAPNNYQKPDLQSILEEVDGSESLAEEANQEQFTLTIHRD
ncbi:MAG: hypothetical protein N4A35_14850 [Flavobacteriales bacterium]|jgi:hypothetical protein|nr:hypothetical protein [Flavobacteriales bacterium]